MKKLFGNFLIVIGIILGIIILAGIPGVVAKDPKSIVIGLAMLLIPVLCIWIGRKIK